MIPHSEKTLDYQVENGGLDQIRGSPGDKLMA